MPSSLSHPLQSGQSLIEHSFKADSDLSPQGEEYARKLRDFIVAKRRELLDERVEAGEPAHERRLTVRPSLAAALRPVFQTQ